MSKNRFENLTPSLQKTKEKGSLVKDESQKLKSVAEQPKRGRPMGKRSSDDFKQVTAYIRRQTYKEVTSRLFVQEPRGEFSELVENLLKEWLAKPPTN